MSLFEIIFSQKIILISIVIALLPLLAAIALALIARLQQFNAERKARRRRARARQMSERLADVPTDAPKKLEAVAQPQAPAKPALTRQTAEASEQGEQAGGQASTENTPSSAMQDILSSVFVDDESSSQYEVLLEGAEEISASQLLTLCNQIAEKLHSPEKTTARNEGWEYARKNR
jgi:hypothetical protein